MRKKLKGLKLNPDVDRKKITNVVWENDKLKKQIEELVEENDALKQKANELEIKNTNLIQNMEGRQSLLNTVDEFGNQPQKDMSRVFEALDLSVFDYSRMGTNSNKITNIKQLIPLKEDFPELFGDKLLNNYRILEEKYVKVHKDLKNYKHKYRILEEKNRLLNDNYNKLSKNYEK